MLIWVIALFPCGAFADTHYIAVASDRHDTPSAISEAMGSMPKSVEFMSIIGDNTGNGQAMSTPYYSSTILNEIKSVFPSLKPVSGATILWADHDEDVIDDAGMVFTNGGYGSSLMKVGKNADGTIAYYIYGISYFDMTTAAGRIISEGHSIIYSDPTLEDFSRYEAEAKKFERWIDTIEYNGIPIIVLCHVPLHYARKDNHGAAAWTKALNYAATGTETPGANADVIRNVVFLFGHNHSYETGKNYSTGAQYSGEFYVPCGSSMKVGTDSKTFVPIYFTYTTAGYLKNNRAASLITIDDDMIRITKYKSGKVVTDLYDNASRISGTFARILFTATDKTIVRTGKIPIGSAKVTGIKKSYVHSGKNHTPIPAVKLNGKTLTMGRDYKVSYSANKAAGTAKYTIKGTNYYGGTINGTFKIKKAENPMTVKNKTVTVKWSKVRNKKLTIKRADAFNIKNAKGTLTFKILTNDKKAGKNISISKGGKLTIKKGLKRRTYTFKIKVTAAGTTNYKKLAKDVTLKVKVK